jgi:hypothetical protein
VNESSPKARSFIQGVIYYIGQSQHPHSCCGWHGRGGGCKEDGRWFVVMAGGPNDEHPDAGMLRWLCAEHALRWITRETASLRRIYRNRQLPAPMISVSMQPPDTWVKADRRASRELAALQRRQP